jgi:diguanylate cyclase (GGDEF)-like protein
LHNRVEFESISKSLPVMAHEVRSARRVAMTITDPDIERLRGALAASGDLVYEWDTVANRISWLTGVSDENVHAFITDIADGREFHDLVYPEDLPYRLEAIDRIPAEDSAFECEFRIRGNEDELLWFHDRGIAVRSPSGEMIGLRGVLRPLGTRARQDMRLDGPANYDTLTGHYNRTRLREALDYALYYSQRYGVEGAYLVIGIDKMTLVNQAFGHEIADSILLSVSERLDRCLRSSDVIGRVGGDRFGAVLTNCPESELTNAAEKILETARTTVVETPSGPIHVTVSIGAVSFPTSVKTAVDAMTKADIALRDAKLSGRDCFAIYSYTEEQRIGHQNDMVIAERVQSAIRDNRLCFAFQPIVDSHTAEPVWFECLLRMVEPDGEVVPAAKFMPVVEDLGMIRPVDRLVLELAIEEVSRYPDARLTLNVSGLTTADRSWLRKAVVMLRGQPRLAERLTVEITETAGLEDVEACSHFVSTLRDLGCQVALDDFGAGYTSFRHLKQLSVNMIKIDGAFVRNIGENPDNLAFVRTLIDLARTFNLRTVAECVETPEEAETMRDAGVDYLQGYAFGAPQMVAPWHEPADAEKQQRAEPQLVGSSHG